MGLQMDRKQKDVTNEKFAGALDPLPAPSLLSIFANAGGQDLVHKLSSDPIF